MSNIVWGNKKKPLRSSGAFPHIKSDLRSLEIDSRHTTSAIGRQFEFNFLAFVQTLQAGFLYSRNVYEHIIAAFIGNDEAEAFFGVEPFYGTAWHTSFSLSSSYRPAAQKLPSSEAGVLKAASKIDVFNYSPADRIGVAYPAPLGNLNLWLYYGENKELSR